MTPSSSFNRCRVSDNLSALRKEANSTIVETCLVVPIIEQNNFYSNLLIALAYSEQRLNLKIVFLKKRRWSISRQIGHLALAKISLQNAIWLQLKTQYFCVAGF